MNPKGNTFEYIPGKLTTGRRMYIEGRTRPDAKYFRIELLKDDTEKYTPKRDIILEIFHNFVKTQFRCRVHNKYDVGVKVKGDDVGMAKDTAFKLVVEATQNGFNVELNDTLYAKYVYECPGEMPTATYFIMYGHVNIGEICFD